MFVTTLVLCAVAFATDGNGTLKRRPFIRDAVFYLATISWLFFIEMDGHVTIVKASLFVVYYVLFVAFVLISRQIYLKYYKRVAHSPADDSDAFDSSLDSSLDSALLSNADSAGSMFEPKISQPVDGSGNAAGGTVDFLLAEDKTAGDLWGWDGGLRLKLRAMRKRESQRSSARMGAGRQRMSMSLTAAEYHRRLNDLDAGFDVSKRKPNAQFRSRSFSANNQSALASYFEDSAENAASGWVQSAKRAQRAFPPKAAQHYEREINANANHNDGLFDVSAALLQALEDFQGQSVIGKILYPVLAPLTLVRRMSIPILGNDFTEDWEEGEANEVARLQREGLAEEGGTGAGGGLNHGQSASLYDVEDDDTSPLDSGEEKSKFADSDGVEGEGVSRAAEEEDDDDDEDGYPWSKGFAIVSCICFPLIAGLGTLPEVWIVENVLPLWSVFVIIGMIFAIVTFKGTSTHHPPRSRCTAMIFLIFGFCASILWIYFIANELVTILNTLGILMGISNSVLGLTVLAWANSAPDTVSIVGVAKAGYVQMAIGGVYAGRMFDTLVGLGLGLTIGTIRSSSGELLLSGNSVLYFSFASLMVSVISATIVVPLSGFKYTKKLGLFLGVLYMVWMVLAILTAVGVISAKLD